MSSDEENIQDGKTRKEIIDKLAKYGDSLLDDDAHQSKRTRKRKKKTDNADPDSKSSQTDQTSIKKRKKKRKKSTAPGETEEASKERVDLDDSGSDSDNELPRLHGEQRHLEQLKEKLGLTDSDFLRSVRQKRQAEKEKETGKLQSGHKSMVPGKRPPPEVIVFDDPAKRNQGKPKKPPPVLIQKRRRTSSDGSDMDSDDDMGPSRGGKRSFEPKPPTDPNMFDMRRAKHDVQMFGITGMQKEDKEKAKLNVLLKLGAKQKKNPYVNYKQFQEFKKKEKADLKVQREVERAMGNRVSKSNNRKQRQRDQNDVGFVDGQIGKYKSGVQVVNKREIHKVKMSSNHRRRR